MTFYFYDLETTGFNPRLDRIMQFAGQRTDENLNPIGKPHNVLIKLSPDVLPSPDAVLVTRITPQQTLDVGISEADFLKIFNSEIATSSTIFLGYNTVRFDDEFIRHLNYRNFYDAYEWFWKDGRGRWDLLDVVRMTRALRPEGIKWPFDPEGRPTNRLELLAKLNKLNHHNAHDALSDVLATIDVAKMIKSGQPKLFEFLLGLRGKRSVEDFINEHNLFLYTSGKYPGEYEKTTIVTKLLTQRDKQSAVVYDLRHDPTQFEKLSVDELVEAWQRRSYEEGVKLPVKTIQYNRCPAVAPLSVLDNDAKARLKLDLKAINDNLAKLKKMKDWQEKLAKAVKALQEKQVQKFSGTKDVDEQLYDSFTGDRDKKVMTQIRKSSPKDINSFATKLSDKRLQKMLPLYKARNFPAELTESEHRGWDKYLSEKLLGGGENSPLANYFKRLSELEKERKSKRDREIIEQLKLYGESITPLQ